MPWILLQARPFLPTANSRATVVFLLIIGAVILALIVGGVIVSRRRRYMDPEARRKFSRQVFHKMARNLGLGRIHIDYLEYLVRVCKVQQPFLVFSNAGLLDDLLRKGIYSLQQNAALKSEDRERRMAHLFQIKQIIERNAGRGKAMRSTMTIRAGQSVSMATADGRQYQSRVISTMRDMIACAAAQDERGAGIRWPRGTTLKLNFWREGDAGYAFESKVLGYDTIKGSVCVLVHHAKTLRREQQRRYRRSPIHRPCFFYPVMVVESGSGRRKERRAVVQTARRLVGNLVDISAGGCSVNGLYPLKAGSLCKIEFELNRRQRMNVFGKVRTVRKSGIRGGVMHVMFTRVSASLLNQIYLYVYDYTPPGGLPQRPAGVARFPRRPAPAAAPPGSSNPQPGT